MVVNRCVKPTVKPVFIIDCVDVLVYVADIVIFVTVLVTVVGLAIKYVIPPPTVVCVFSGGYIWSPQ